MESIGENIQKVLKTIVGPVQGKGLVNQSCIYMTCDWLYVVGQRIENDSQFSVLGVRVDGLT